MKTNHYNQKSVIRLTVIATLLGCINSHAQNSSTWPSTGPVGIGTTTPAQPLHVVGKTRFDVNATGVNGGRFYHTRPSSSNYENLISFGSNGTGSYEWIMGTQNSSTDFVINGNTTTIPFRIQSNGNIGLSLSSSYVPLTKVQIGGNTLFSPTSVQPDETIWSSAYIKSNSIPSAPANPDYTWYQNENTGFFHPAMNVIGFCSNGSEKMRIHSNGYVGIGTNNPATQLHVNGFATISNLAGTGFRSVVVDATGKLVAGTASSTSSVPFIFGGNTITNPATQYLGSINNADLNINTNGLSRITIKADGKVGINTSSPSAGSILEIKDNAAKSFIFYGNGWGDIQSTASFRPHFASGGDFSIYEGTLTSGLPTYERFAIKNGGEVTINNLAGTGVRTLLVDPSGRLVPGTATSASTVDWALGGNAISNPASEWLGTTTDQPIHFHTNGGKKMSITKEGRVVVGYEFGNEIGQINATAWKERGYIKLHAYTDNGQPARPVSLHISNAVGGAEFRYDSLGNGHIDWNSTKNITFRDESVLIGPEDANNSSYGAIDINTKLMISTKTPNGYTGIPLRIVNPTLSTTNKVVFEVLEDGTTHIGNKKAQAPHNDAKLSVDGKIACKSLYVLKPVSWADHVFKTPAKENLRDVEKYLNENKHLPNIPSEEEIYEKGYDVNDIDARLLSKIEQLYLHVIELEKEISILKQNQK